MGAGWLKFTGDKSFQPGGYESLVAGDAKEQYPAGYLLVWHPGYIKNKGHQQKSQDVCGFPAYGKFSQQQR